MKFFSPTAIYKRPVKLQLGEMQNTILPSALHSRAPLLVDELTQITFSLDIQMPLYHIEKTTQT